MKLHNSTSSSNTSVDMIVSISRKVWLCLSECLCNFLYLWHYILYKFVLPSFLHFYRANFHAVDFLIFYFVLPSFDTVGWAL